MSPWLDKGLPRALFKQADPIEKGVQLTGSMEAGMKVLCIDGGGMYGAIPATQLTSIDPWREFDAFGGTSIGSAIVASYAVGMSARDVASEMNDEIPLIFSRPWWWKLKPWGPKWPDKELVRWCKDRFDIPLGRVTKPIYIVAMDFARRRPKVFSSRDKAEADTPLYEAVLASVSGPTYFPPRGNWVDGGLFANNPSLATCAGLCAHVRGLDMTKISLFSAGTGRKEDAPLDMANAANWNLVDWGTRIIPVLLDGTNEKGVEYITRQLPLKDYVRSNLVARIPGVDMDDVDSLPEVAEAAKKTVPAFSRSIKAFLKRNSG